MSNRKSCLNRINALGATSLLLVLSALPSFAAGERPASFEKSAAGLDRVPKLSTPAIDVQTLLAEDEQVKANGRAVPTRFASAAEVAYGLGDGTWETLADGTRLWRLRIAAPGSSSINVTFDRFELSAGAKLWLYDPAGSLVRGPFRQQDSQGGKLWTPIVLGDEVVVELAVPAGAPEPALSIAAVNRGYRAFGLDTNKDHGACNNDVVCSEGDPYRSQIRGVGVYSLNGIFLCSGTMMNNSAVDFRPLFLTANHCFQFFADPDAAADSMIVYWNYQAPTCGAQSGGSLNQFQAGADVLASHDPTDFFLAELDQQPNNAWGVYYAGWDAGGATPQSVVGIHHPSTDVKSISFEDDPLDLAPNNFGVTPETHWKVTSWDDGTTEGGSSGSCIFDQESKLCVGTLTGGFASCPNANNGNPDDDQDWYGKMSAHWTGGGTADTRLRDHLDPRGSSGGRLEGADSSNCISGPNAMCLNGGRFRVEVDWRDFENRTGDGQVVPFGSDDSGLFWFFNADNWEMLVKILDGCPVNNHFWVFAAATTNVEYTLTVTDTQTNQVSTYENPLGNASPAITDTGAFATCP